MRRRSRSEKWQTVRGRILELKGLWMARMLGASKLWMKGVSGGRLESEVSVI